MKFTVYGFLQKNLVEMGLDVIDAMLLRYFVDFKASNKMRFEMIEDNLYFWVNYDNVVKELPILNMKKRTIQTRFLKLRDAGILTHYVKKSGGTYSFFGIGERYGALVSEGACIDKENNVKGMDDLGEVTEVSREPRVKEQVSRGNTKMSQEVTLEELRLSEEGPQCGFILEGSSLKGHHSSLNEHPSNIDGQGSQFKMLTEYPSTKDPSIINNTPSPLKGTLKDKEVVKVEDALEDSEAVRVKETMKHKDKEMVKEIINYLNKATGKSFNPEARATMRYIKARVKEGFILEDFYRVIDNMVFNWTGTKFQPYLVPGTLFSSKFENYLHMGKVKNMDYGGGNEQRSGYVYGGAGGFMGGGAFKNRPMKQGNVGSRAIVEAEFEGGKKSLRKEERQVNLEFLEDM